MNMKTDEFIRALAADPIPEPGVGRSLATALGLGGLVSVAGFLVALGPREDVAEAFARLVVILKPVLGLTLAGGALGAVLAATRPGAPMRGWLQATLIGPALAALALLGACLATPIGQWGAACAGQAGSLTTCLTSIPLLSLPLLAGSLLALRRGASPDPRRTGALAGLLSGGIAVVIYSFYCIEESPIFYALWYSVAVCAVAALGAALGQRVLRW
jgi:hypothetical protein